MSLEHLWKTNPLPGRIRPQDLELDEQLDELDAIQAHKSYQKDMFNPCGHSGFESAPCPVCGYPDPVSLISILRTENERMHKSELARRMSDLRSTKVLHSIRILIQDFLKEENEYDTDEIVLTITKGTTLEAEAEIERIKSETRMSYHSCNKADYHHRVKELKSQLAAAEAEIEKLRIEGSGLRVNVIESRKEIENLQLELKLCNRSRKWWKSLAYEANAEKISCRAATIKKRDGCQ